MQVQSLGQEDFLKQAWQPPPVFFPGESHGQRSLVGYSPQGRKELDMTEATQQQQRYLICISILLPCIIIFQEVVQC